MEKLEDQRKYMGKEGKGTLERGNDGKSIGDGVVGGWVDTVESTQLQAIRQKQYKAESLEREVRAIEAASVSIYSWLPTPPWSPGFSPLKTLQS